MILRIVTKNNILHGFKWSIEYYLMKSSNDRSLCGLQLTYLFEATAMGSYEELSLRVHHMENWHPIFSHAKNRHPIFFHTKNRYFTPSYTKNRHPTPSHTKNRHPIFRYPTLSRPYPIQRIVIPSFPIWRIITLMKLGVTFLHMIRNDLW